MDDLRRHDQLLGAAFGNLARRLAAYRADQLLQPAHTCFARVMARNQADARGRELDDRVLAFLRLDAVLLDLARNQVALRDVDLLLFGVAGQLDDLHAVEQRRRDRVQLVGCADEKHLAQIERLIEIVVAERVVLLRIERLQQRARGVATEVAAQLVDLVQHEDRIVHLDTLQVLNDLPRQRADVGPAMTANLRLVVHAAERDAAELPSQRPRNAAAERGFAHARRPDKAQDRPLHIRLQTPNAQVIQDAVLHLLQAVVILVEELLGLLDVDLAGRALRPGQNGQPLHVVARQRVVRRRRIHPRQPGELLQRILLGLLRHAGGFDLLLEVRDVLLGLVQVAQLLLDGLHLLAQIEVPLRLLDRILNLALDLVAQLLNPQLLGQVAVDHLQPRLHVGGLEQLLLLGGGQKRQAGRDEVRQPRRLLDIESDGLQIVREGRGRRHNLLELRQNVPLQGLGLRRALGDDLLQRASSSPSETAGSGRIRPA